MYVAYFITLLFILFYTLCLSTPSLHLHFTFTSLPLDMSGPSQGHRLPFMIHYFNWYNFLFSLPTFMAIFWATGSQSCYTTPIALLLAPCLVLPSIYWLVVYSCCSHLEHRASMKCFVSLQFLNLRYSVGLLGQAISPSQGHYLTQTE
jgi:hypothetical protein